MEQQPENLMNESERNMLLLEYGKILLRRAEEDGSQPTDEEIRKMAEIEATLGLDSDAVTQEAYQYLGKTVRP